MAIKVKLGATENTQQKKFPKLMKGAKGSWLNQICFFEKPKRGMLLGPIFFGYADNFNMDDFEDYNSSVTLINE